MSASWQEEEKEGAVSMMQTQGDLASLQFDNRFIRELPADPLTGNSRRQVTGAC